MAWNTTMTTMLRVLINDTSEESYTDSQLEQILVVAARYVIQEVSPLLYTYTITIGTPDISPDPTTSANLDDDFTNFIVLKAACIIDMNTLRVKAAISGITASLGPATLTTGGHLRGFETLIKEGPCKAYEELKEEHNFNGTSHIKAVLSPFVSNSFDPRNLRTFADLDYHRSHYNR